MNTQERRGEHDTQEARSTADAVARRSYGKLVAFLAARTRDVAAAGRRALGGFCFRARRLAAEWLSVESGSVAAHRRASKGD
jgi:hypothetical protein